VPAIELAKGGGAIRGIGEKFAANSATGTGSMSIPIATSPGRAGFGPQLALAYDSGSGNGPFGFGWSLSLPAILRKTDKGLPRYADAEESDVFILSGTEDLVPALEAGGARHRDTTSAAGYAVERYRPRIEGLFARIERWTRLSDGDVHWRSISKDNVLTLYGGDADSRIVDPMDPRHIFSWLICETRDVRGNAIVYRYKREDGTGCDLARACERNRGDHNDVRRSANRYLKRILYGNRAPLLNGNGRRPRFLDDLPAAQLAGAGWMFELVLDYGEHGATAPKPDDAGPWLYRDDPFSSCRSGFEVRMTRLCRRALMYHHIPDTAGGVGYDGLVRSTDFTYSHQQEPASARNAVYTFLRAVTQSGYRPAAAGYEKRSLPPVEFEYSKPIVQDQVELVDVASLGNLPVGVDGSAYRWTDLHGEGIPGILTEQADALFYKRNLSPLRDRAVAFGPMRCVSEKPNMSLARGAQVMDLSGDGRPDLVVLDGPTPGFYAHDADQGWQPFRSFLSRLNVDTRDPNLRFVDLNGDGRADLLITEDDALVWHSALGEDGFGPARRTARALDEEKGPRLVFADVSQSVHLADMNGDGLSDLARVRNGEVCYWPNLGYGRFGAKVTMDRAPRFDSADQYDPARVRLADLDGSGTADLVYLRGDGVRLYFNESGNGWSEPRRLHIFPRVDELVAIEVADLLGNGTACLVWSSPLAGDAERQMRYVNLIGPDKPHLLVRTINNLGAETRIRYAPSTKFYLEDERAGRPWLTRLPFPVHVVERTETIDHIARSRFVARYAYHHGYFDGPEREFRGFGMVEQWDTEELAALTADDGLTAASNLDPASHVPPVLTRSWFHTGLYLGRDHVSDFFAGRPGSGGAGEYFREPGPVADALDRLLPDTVLPSGLSVEEEREACRALKGSMLRQEIYALDGTAARDHPYTVVEQNFTVRREQPKGANRHAVFFTHSREALTYHYERQPSDPRVQHALTLEVDGFGNVLEQASIGYGRRQPDLALPLDADRERQTQLLATCSEHLFTGATDGAATPDDYCAPLPAESRTWELTGFIPSGPAGRFRADDFVPATGVEIPYEAAPGLGPHRRLIEHVRTLYRADDLSALLALGSAGLRGLRGESYKLAFTPGLLDRAFERGGVALLQSPAALLGAPGGEGGGYVSSQQAKADGRFPAADPDDHWWIPSGREFLSPVPDDPPGQELAFARDHFFLPRRSRDPFHTAAASTETLLSWDEHDLLLRETRDPVGNRVTAGQRQSDGSLDPGAPGNDYRVLQPALITDPNRNRAASAFDALGLVVGTAVMGKAEESLGDSLAGFVSDLAEADLLAHFADPLAGPHALLGRATTRLVYDLDAYHRTRHLAHPQAPSVCTMARETHDADLAPGETSKIQQAFSYSDGFGREIQKKIQAEPGPVEEGGPIVAPRWVGSGWTIFNNKGKPVRQYEPFFSATHAFEFGVEAGVGPILFYDPAGRAVATLHPDHSYEKVTFDPWRQVSWDRNDTVLGDPRTDPDLAGYVARYFAALGAGGSAAAWMTWHGQRQSGALGAEAQAAAAKAAAHAATPTTACFDALGRPFLTLADNGPDPDDPMTHQLFATRVELDIEGNQRAVRDAIEQAGDPRGRIVMRYDYDMLGHRIRQSSMEAGERWTLSDAAGKPLRAWDSRGHDFRTGYDPLRRPLRTAVRGADEADPVRELVTDRLVYGEQHPQAEQHNLRGKLHLHLDQAGAVVAGAHDFKGNPLEAARRLTEGTRYRAAMDWASVDADLVALPADAAAPFDPVALEAALLPRLEPESYASRTLYDALNRPVAQITPHTPGMSASTIRPRYNEANLLEAVDVNLRGATVAGVSVWTNFVANIDYDAKGQRRRIDYGNKVSAFYDYDPLTYRLTRLTTRRDAADFPGDCPQSPTAGWPGCQVQDLHYSYDPIGNITRIEDRAQQAIFFANSRVEPSSDYVYDPLYRLVEATGREHLGQGGAPIPHSSDDAQRRNLPHPSDGLAMGTYIESYVYDAVGNLLKMKHAGANPVQPGWTRTYAYAEPSLTEPGKTSNRLGGTRVGGNPAETYDHDAHGNMIRMPHLGGADPAGNMAWNERDQLARVSLGGGGKAYYMYDAAGQRVRKVWEKSASLIEERLYLGGFEIFRRRQVGDLLERETLHVMDDKQRIALVETRTVDTVGFEAAPAQSIRYQLGNHLGSSSLELDEAALIVSYEEYSAYGSTTYHAGRTVTEAPKRFRYIGKERDEESGFSAHGARYYAAWLARWVSCDPSGLQDGPNVFGYVSGNPVRFVDGDGQQKAAFDDDFLKRMVAAGAAMQGSQAKQTSTQASLTAAKLTGAAATYGVQPSQTPSTKQSHLSKPPLMMAVPTANLTPISGQPIQEGPQGSFVPIFDASLNAAGVGADAAKTGVDLAKQKFHGHSQKKYVYQEKLPIGITVEAQLKPSAANRLSAGVDKTMKHMSRSSEKLDKLGKAFDWIDVGSNVFGIVAGEFDDEYTLEDQDQAAFDLAQSVAEMCLPTTIALPVGIINAWNTVLESDEFARHSIRELGFMIGTINRQIEDDPYNNELQDLKASYQTKQEFYRKRLHPDQQGQPEEPVQAQFLPVRKR